MPIKTSHWQFANRAIQVASVCLAVCGVFLVGGCHRGSTSASGAAGQQDTPAEPKASPFAMSRKSKQSDAKPVGVWESHQRMLAELEVIRDATPYSIEWLGDADMKKTRQEIEKLPLSADVEQHYALRLELAKLELRLGNEQEAIDALFEAESMLNQSRLPAEVDTPLRLKLQFEIGVAHLRFAETQNCCSRHTPDSCIVPIQGAGIHTQPAGSREAIRRFQWVLETAAPRSEIWLQACWLYNIAHMTLGEYPGQVDPEWRIPEGAFASTVEFPEFPNLAQDRGVDTFSLSGGAIAEDFDLDGDVDLMVSALETHEVGQLRLFMNDGTGTFTETTEEAGLLGLFGGLNLMHADYNEDGLVDVLVLRGGWFKNAGRQPNSLLQNNGDGTFVDVTYAAGVQGDLPTQTADWADYDNDGDVDLYVGNEHTGSVLAPCQLFRNEGDGSFVDVAEEAGVANRRFAKSVTWGDIDNDRRPDLYVSNFGDTNRLYYNNGDGTFTDIAIERHVEGPQQSFPSWFWDVNNDGHQDLLVTGYIDDIAYVAAEELGMQHDGTFPRLYIADGQGGFIESAEKYGIRRGTAPMGSNFGDLDNDGRLDFYLGTGEPNYRNLMPNRFYHNVGDRFEDITMAGRFGHLQKGHGIVFADFDQDGDIDVFQQTGGAYPGDRYYDSYFENPGFDNNYIAIHLIGIESSRSCIGARLEVTCEDEAGQRTIHRMVGSGGTFGANSFVAWIGLGHAKEASHIKVTWPSGTVRHVEAAPAGQTLTLIEGDEGR